MLLNSIKEINRLRKEIHRLLSKGMFWIQLNRFRKETNRLLSKGMSHIHVEIAVEKTWRSQNFDFLRVINLSPGQFLSSSNSRRYHWILKILVATEKSEVWEQNCLRLFYYINFEINYDIHQKVHVFCWTKI